MKTLAFLSILIVSSSAFAGFQVDKNLLVPDSNIDQDVGAPIQGVIYGKDSNTVYVDDSAQIQKVGYRCSAPILFLHSGYQRLCGYEDLRAPITSCSRGKQLCVTPGGGSYCIPANQTCAFIGCPDDPWGHHCRQ